MKITSQIILAASLLFLASCTENNKTGNAAIGTTPVNFSAPGSQQQPAAGTNPAHGQPGHRCDIPVGASLSTPTQADASAPANAPQPTPIPLPTSNASRKVAPGTNPPHGEPGHDCSVAVGAPLNN